MRRALVVVLAAAASLVQASPAPLYDAPVSRAVSAVNPCTLNSNPPFGAICGLVGILQHPSEYDNVQAPAVTTNSAQCRDKCLAMRLCLSYSWNSDLKVCKFFSKITGQMGFVEESSSDVTFYDRQCYTCTGCTTIVDNPGFETGSLSPWIAEQTSSDAVVSVSTTGDNSPHSANITLGPNEAVDFLQFVRQCNRQRYVLQFDYRFVTASPTVLLGYINASTRNHTKVFQVSNNASNFGLWHTATGTPATGYGNGLIDIRVVTLRSAQTVLIDNVKYIQQ